MIAPHELRKKDFTRTMRGYNPAEVDEYISYLITNYVEVYRENNDLEKKIEVVVAENDRLSRDSETVRTALLDAQTAAEKIVADANEEARIIVASSKRNVDNIINEFRAVIAEERDKLITLQNAVTDFKAKLYSEYQDHIDRIEEMSELADWSDLDLDEETYTRKIVTDIKSDVAYALSERNSRIDIPVGDEAPDPEHYDAANKAEQDENTAEAPAVEAEALDEVIAEAVVEAGEEPAPNAADEPIDPPVEADGATRIFDISDTDAEGEAKSEETISEEYDEALEKFAEELAAEKSDDAAPADKEDAE